MPEMGWQVVHSCGKVSGTHRRVDEKDGIRQNRRVDIRLHGKGHSNAHGARPVHLIITMV